MIRKMKKAPWIPIQSAFALRSVVYTLKKQIVNPFLKKIV